MDLMDSEKVIMIAMSVTAILNQVNKNMAREDKTIEHCILSKFFETIWGNNWQNMSHLLKLKSCEY